MSKPRLVACACRSLSRHAFPTVTRFMLSDSKVCWPLQHPVQRVKLDRVCALYPLSLSLSLTASLLSIRLMPCLFLCLLTSPISLLPSSRSRRLTPHPSCSLFPVPFCPRFHPILFTSLSLSLAPSRGALLNMSFHTASAVVTGTGASSWHYER